MAWICWIKATDEGVEGWMAEVKDSYVFYEIYVEDTFTFSLDL